MDEPRPDEELHALRERAKELRCLYEVVSALGDRQQPPTVVFGRVLTAIPPAWQFPGDTTARIEYLGRTHALADFVDTPWRQRAPISIWRTPVGALEVHYKRVRPPAWEGPFLREERQLLDNIAQRLGEYLEWKQRELGGERVGADPEHWRWRQRFAERLAALADPPRFGVEKVYLYGSTELGTAGPASDIDLLVVFGGDERQRLALEAWLAGWSACLCEMSFQLHGLPGSGILDVRVTTPREAESLLRAFAAAGTTVRELPVGSSPSAGEEPSSRGSVDEGR